MAEESYETTEEYIEESKSLFELIERREEMLRILKIAQPEYIPEVQKAIAQIDDLIERTEELMEMHRKLYFMEIEIDKNDAELVEFTEKVDKALREYVAKNNPEKLELIEAMLSDDGKSH